MKKLEDTVSKRLSVADFHQQLASISKLQHHNVVKLIGYCLDHGQRMLVYQYCEYETLYDALHMDEEIHFELSWDKRIQIALRAARALELVYFQIYDHCILILLLYCTAWSNLVIV